MLEILLKVLFFLSMLVVYAYVTSTVVVVVIVAIYVTCVFSYYYFDNIQAIIDQWSHYLNLEARFNDSMNPSHLSAYFVNRKFKMSNSNTTMSSASGKKMVKMFNSSCNPDVSFAQENCPLEARSSSVKTNADLPSPIMKNSSSRSARLSRDGLKLGVSTKSNGTRKNPLSGYGSVGPNQRYNTNLDLETYMNVNSPGFTSRVVDKATESASYHIKYPAVRQIPTYRFDKSTLRQLSKIPKANFSAAVRIAPPEMNNVEFSSTNSVVNEPTNENFRNNDYLQVLRDISRKRNYSQEEIDRSITTPKKSRKNDAKNAISSQYKRAHEDCSNDSIDDQNCKKRCDDVDRNYAKMMSFTSSISVLVPEFSWSSSTKKRKSSRLDKSENESPEKIEKCRKIDEEADERTDESEERTTESETDSGQSNKHEEEEIKRANRAEDVQNTDETDSFQSHMSIAEDNEEYVRVAGGKILNRTNCTYRKKMNSTKIDPVSVISTEPEYVSDMAYVDDKIMKENLLNNLMNDIERKGEKDDKVIFYQNSIVEEIEKQSTAIEAQRTNTSVLTSSSFNPLLPTTVAKPTINHDQTDASPAPSAVQQTQPTVSLSNSTNPPQIFNSEPPVEVSKTIPGTSSAKNEIVTNVASSSFVAPVSSASNTLFQSLASPSNNASESKDSTSTGTAQFNVSVSNTTKPSGSYFSPVFGGISNPMSVPAVSNSSSKTDNETSSVTASSNSSSSPIPLEPQPKPAVNNSPSCSSASVALISTSSSVSSNPSLFTTNSSTFSIPHTTFTMSNSTGQNQETKFNFGSKSTPTFQQSNSADGSSLQMSVFNADAVSAAPSASVFGTTSQPTSNVQPNIFGAIQPSQTSASPSVFGAGSQAAPSVVPAPSIFGVSSQPASAVVPATPSVSQSMFGSITPSTAASTPATFSSNVSTQSSAAVQPSVFGNASLFQSQASSQPQVPAFGSSGDLSANVFGQSQSAQPRVGVVNPLPQAVPQFGIGNAAAAQFGSNNSSSRFTFGSVSGMQPDAFGSRQTSAPPAFGAQQPSAPAAFGSTSAPAAFGAQPTSLPTALSTTSMQSPFGAKPVASSNVGAISSGTPQFNFTAPSPFGSAANAFNTAPNVPPSSGGAFNFGASNSQPSQPAFQFGGPNPAATSNQPFMFGGNAAPVPNSGGFSIGSGGSSGRSRASARPRKVK